MTLVSELKRRNVFRVGAAYGVAAWLLIQVAETIFPLFGFDETPARIVVIVLAIGFLPTLVVTWVFEWTPEGIRRDRDAGQPESDADTRLDRWIMTGLVVALAYFAFDKFVLEPQREAAAQQAQAEQLITAAEEAHEAGRTEALLESYGDQSIAVLPFVDMSPEGDQEYFSDGISEEVLNLLARIPELRVISRSSSFAVKGQALEIPEVAKRLKVAHVLEGSVRKSGNTLRITAQLIEARTDTHLWSQNWDRELTDVFAIQDEIAAQVVSELQLTLLGGAQAEDVVDPRAYEAILRGRHLLHEQNAEAIKRAVTFFREAIEFDPDYAPAHSGLAKALKQYLDISRGAPVEVIPDIETSLERALTLDPNDPDALTTRGKMFWGTDVEKARAYWRQAIAINPNDSDAYRWLGYSYRATEPALYFKHIQSGYRVDPTNAFMNRHMVIALINFGRFDEALAVARDFHRLKPDAWQPYQWAAQILAFQGRRGESLKIYYRAFQQDQVSMRYNELLWHLLDYISAPNELIYSWLEYWKEREGADYLIQEGIDLGPEAAYYVVSRKPERAIQFITDAWMDGSESAWFVAYLTLRATHDYASAREFYERASDEWGFKLDRFNPEFQRWETYTDLALIFQQTGEPGISSTLLRDTTEYVEFLLGEQVIFGPGNHHLFFHLAMLHTIAGRPQQAIAALRDAMASGFHVCGACLRIFPHFNSLRGVEPEFDALVVENEARNAVAIQRLEAEGMLLTADQVLALEPIEFDPFAN